MTGAIGSASRLIVAPVLAAGAGSVMASRHRFTASTTSAVQHLAAGIVTAAVAGEVLPDLRDRHSLAATIVGFVVGVAVMLGLARLEKRADARGGSTPGLPTAMIAALAIDLFIDGLLVGVGAALGESQGRVLTIALTFEILFLALSLTGELTERGLGPARAALIPVTASGAAVAGALVGAAALAGAGNGTQAAVLAFGSAALLYLAVEELLAEAHETADSQLHVLAYFVGFVALFTVEGLL